MTMPMAVMVPLGLGAYNIGKAVLAGNNAYAVNAVTGWNGTKWDPKDEMVGFYLPILGGVAVHKAAKYLGVNKMLASAKIPFIRL